MEMVGDDGWIKHGTHIENWGSTINVKLKVNTSCFKKVVILSQPKQLVLGP